MSVTGQNRLTPTNEDTVGPYFPIYFAEPSLQDLTQVDAGVVAQATGQPIVLRGRVFDRHGDLANGVVLEFWQANAKGIYRTPETAMHPDIDPWFHGYGRLRTGTGAYEFRTIMPGPVDGRSPNITITIFSDGINRVVTQVFFEGAAGNDIDPVLISVGEDAPKLLARYDGRTASGADVYCFDIVMAGADETPFFDDMES